MSAVSCDESDHCAECEAWDAEFRWDAEEGEWVARADDAPDPA